MKRKEVRYSLFRWQNAENGGAEMPETEEMLRVIDAFEGNQWFKRLGGIANFGKTWDVSETDPLAMVPRDKSLLEEWNEICLENARDLPDSSLEHSEESPMINSTDYESEY